MPEVLPQFSLATGLLFLLVFLLVIGRRLGPAIQLERLGIPIALLAGLIGLCLGPYGPVQLLPQSITDIWSQLPIPLLTFVFATLLIGRPLPSSKGLWKPVASQALLGLLLGFGQYFVGGLVVLLVLIPRLGVDPLMGCLIEVGFEGGHGAASIMGDSFSQLGFIGGKDLGLAMATVGLLASTILGSILVILGRIYGWLTISELNEVDILDLEIDSDDFFQKIRSLGINLAFAGLAVLLGVVLLFALRKLDPWLGDLYSQVIDIFPVFPLALLGSLIVRLLLESFNKTAFVSQILQREMGTLATDLLIITATASLNIPVLQADLEPLLFLAGVGLIWNLIVMLVFAKFILPEEWFERSVAEFGNATGVAASGLLLLRLADPTNQTSTLPIFSIKQLFIQPILSGGIVTVLAPIVIVRIGLLGWTEISGVLTLIFLLLALILSNYRKVIALPN